MRATHADVATFAAVYEAAVRGLEPLATRDRMRWLDLLWFVFSWVVQRRSQGEQQPLFALAEARVQNVAVREEVKRMIETVPGTWADHLKQQFLTAEWVLHTTRQCLKDAIEARFGAFTRSNPSPYRGRL